MVAPLRRCPTACDGRPSFCAWNSRKRQTLFVPKDPGGIEGYVSPHATTPSLPRVMRSRNHYPTRAVCPMAFSAWGPSQRICARVVCNQSRSLLRPRCWRLGYCPFCVYLWWRKRVAIPHIWLPILGTLVVGVSFGLPLSLSMRQRALDATPV